MSAKDEIISIRKDAANATVILLMFQRCVNESVGWEKQNDYRTRYVIICYNTTPNDGT